MFYTNQNGNILCSDDRLILEKFYKNIQELPNITTKEYQTNKDKFKLEDNQIINIENTAEYILLEKEKTKNLEIEQIKKELEELDIKSIRAMREPSLINQESEQTWLEYYQNQITNLRNRLNQLSSFNGSL